MYTDGSASLGGNPKGVGGWCALVYFPRKDNARILKGNMRNCNNERAELYAVVKGLEFLRKPADIIIYCDCQYVTKTIQEGLLDKWRKNNWHSNKHKVYNKDLWLRLEKQLHKHKVKFIWVKHHSTDYRNVLADCISKQEMKSLRNKNKSF